jgi:quinol monooxygenase YgiN
MIAPVSAEYIVIASATAKVGRQAELEHALLEVQGPTRAQAGCRMFQLLRQSDNPLTIVGLERWSSRADHENHMKGPHFRLLAQRMTGILERSPTVISYQEIG